MRGPPDCGAVGEANITEYSELIADKVPDAELFVVRDANHGVHLEKNELVLDKMAAFLQ